MFFLGKNRIKVSKIERGRDKFRRAASFLLCLLLFVGVWSFCCSTALSADVADKIEEPDNLYAQAAVLMDADSGRVLFNKNGCKELPMASTTKIMTCILALEYGNPEDVVTASANASAQPQVHLGIQEGMQFRLRDLLYSLMLESHNDTAVMIAEHIGTSVQGFADMMNEKAREIGCQNTYYITPNGLDSQDENGIHHTTAQDLAAVMKYCIMDSPQRESFLEVTQTREYQFSDCSGTRTFSCTNHNSLFNMMSGVLSGKTGFTGAAGYCYVGAVENGGRTFIVALLACGWPNNKGYKWADTKKLIDYGTKYYHYRNIYSGVTLPELPVSGGIPDNDKLSGISHVSLKMTSFKGISGKSGLSLENGSMELMVLLRDDEKPVVEAELERQLQAPVVKGTDVGGMQYKLGDQVLYSCRFVTASDVDERKFGWCYMNILKKFCVQK